MAEVDPLTLTLGVLDAQGHQWALVTVDPEGVSHLRYSAPTAALLQGTRCLAQEVAERAGDVPLGQLVYRCRVAQRLSRAQAAERLGVSRFTLQRWELSGRVPEEHLDAALEFVGDEEPPPLPDGQLGDRLRAARVSAGWNRAQVAASVGVWPTTVRGWEHGAEVAPELRHEVLELCERLEGLAGGER